MKNREMNLTQGSILSKLIMFALPLLGTNILQVLFNVADVTVLGFMTGDEKVAAVGATGALTSLIVNLFIGLSTGANVVVARLVGEGNKERATRAVGTSIVLSLIVGVFVGAVGFFGARTFLTWMSCDPAVIDYSVLYMRIYFLGMPIILLYNFAASILRAAGDTFHPFLYLLIGGGVNVLLNIFFIAVFHMDVDGVAIATVSSQLISAVLALITMFRSNGYASLRLSYLGVDRKELLVICRIGIPTGVQGMVFALSNVFAQSSINSLGKAAMAGNSIGSHIDGLIYNAMYAVALTALAFVSQNLGAGKIDRMRRSVRLSLLIVTVLGLILGLSIGAIEPVFASLMSDDPAVIEFTRIRGIFVGMLYFFCGWMDVLSCSVRGLGKSTLSMINSLLGSCAFRLLWFSIVFPLWHPANGVSIQLVYPISWALTALIQLIVYRRLVRKLEIRFDAGSGAESGAARDESPART